MRRYRRFASSIVSVLPLALFALLVAATPAAAQVRGLYTPGVNATNSGTLPAPGLTYSNVFLNYSFNEIKGPIGGTIPVDANIAVFMDFNLFVYVTKAKVLGASLAFVTGLTLVNSSLSAANEPMGGGGGFGPMWVQPLTLGWQRKRADIQFAYAFIPPTGRYSPGATNNVSPGYWANCLALGETFHLTKDKKTALSAYQLYEFHTEKEGTGVTPGQTFNLDYSLTRIFVLGKSKTTMLQLGLVGYGQWQTTDNSGAVNAVQARLNYGVNGLGGAANLILPLRKASLGVKYFAEFGNKDTVQGHSLQISGAITF